MIKSNKIYRTYLYKWEENSLPTFPYTTLLLRELCARTVIYNTMWLLAKLRVLKWLQLWGSKPTVLLHIWHGREELRHVHYHLLLPTESTKKLMRRREVSCQIFHFVSQYSYSLSISFMLLFSNFSTHTVPNMCSQQSKQENLNYTLT